MFLGVFDNKPVILDGDGAVAQVLFEPGACDCDEVEVDNSPVILEGDGDGARVLFEPGACDCDEVEGEEGE